MLCERNGRVCRRGSIWLSVGLLGLAFQLPASAQNASLYDQGKAAFTAHHWADAASLMARAAEQDSGSSDALLFEGKALANLERFPEADVALTRYSQRHPNSAQALFMLGFVQHRENKPSESLVTYTAAARLATPRGDDLKIVGLNYVLLNDYPDAIHWLEKAVEFEPGNAGAWYSVGRCYYTQSSFRNAERAFQKVLALEPKNVKAAENLALTLDAENRPAEADRAFAMAVTLARDAPHTDEWPYLNYGGFLLDHDRAAEAVPILQQAVAIAPKCVACHEKLGRALVATGSTKSGIAELERAATLGPDVARLHYELGLAYRTAGMTDRAKAEFAASEKLYGAKSGKEPQ
jgi:tetratricopeptide (TPR) repeat protein